MSDKIELTPEQMETLMAALTGAAYIIPKLVDAISAIGAENIAVPSKEKLRELKSELNKLEDL